jgi:hypothetical protein
LQDVAAGAHRLTALQYQQQPIIRLPAEQPTISDGPSRKGSADFANTQKLTANIQFLPILLAALSAETTAHLQQMDFWLRPLWGLRSSQRMVHNPVRIGQALC